MSDGLDMGEIVRRSVQANTQFYKGWFDLSLEYMRTIADIFGGVTEAAPGDQPLETGAGVLVLEAEAGTGARGAFLVTNDLGRTLKCELVASDFTDSRGANVSAQVKFEPASVELAPGEQRVVQATIPIPDELAAGVAYSGQFAIKGMDGFSVPVVLRRTHRVDESPIGREEAREKQPPATAKKKAPAGPRKSSRQKK